MREWLICCCESEMTDGLRCRCQLHLIGSECLEVCVEKHSEAISRSD